MEDLTTTPLRYTLSKEERLHLKRDVDALFASGHAFIAYPLRVVVNATPIGEGDPIGEGEEPSCAILAVAAKKYFRRANKRNRVKRLIRESYRLRKHRLLDLAKAQGLHIHLGLLSVAKELPTQADVNRGMDKALSRICEELMPKAGEPTNEEA